MGKQAPEATQVETEVLEPTAAEVLAQQMEGFQEAVNTTTPTKTETAQAAEATQEAERKAQQEAEDAAKNEAAKAEQEKAAKEKEEQSRQKLIAGYTEAQVAELLKKASEHDKLQGELSKAFGKLGNLEQQLKALGEARGAPVTLTEEDVAEYAGEYGPEAANALLKLLNKMAAKGVVADTKAKAPTAEEAIAAAQKEYDEKLATSTGKVREELTHEFEKKILNLTHKDWTKLVRKYDEAGKDIGLNDNFKVWVATLPEEEQKKLLDGWDALFISDKITQYKDHLKQTAEAAAAQKKAEEEKARKDRPTVPGRLKAAVQTQGVPAQVSTKTALEEQKEGYQSV